MHDRPIRAVLGSILAIALAALAAIIVAVSLAAVDAPQWADVAALLVVPSLTAYCIVQRRATEPARLAHFLRLHQQAPAPRPAPAPAKSPVKAQPTAASARRDQRLITVMALARLAGGAAAFGLWAATSDGRMSADWLGAFVAVSGVLLLVLPSFEPAATHRPQNPWLWLVVAAVISVAFSRVPVAFGSDVDPGWHHIIFVVVMLRLFVELFVQGAATLSSAEAEPPTFGAQILHLCAIGGHLFALGICLLAEPSVVEAIHLM